MSPIMAVQTSRGKENAGFGADERNTTSLRTCCSGALNPLFGDFRIHGLVSGGRPNPLELPVELGDGGDILAGLALHRRHEYLVQAFKGVGAVGCIGLLRLPLA